MEELADYRRGLLSALEGVVPALSKIMDTMPKQAWQASYEISLRSPHYILTGLLVLEEQLFTRNIHRICTEDSPELPAFDVTAWMESHYESQKPVHVMLNDFAHLRRKEVEWLRGCTPKDWSRTARHPWWGVRASQWWVELQLEYSHQHMRELASLAAA